MYHRCDYVFTESCSIVFGSQHMEGSGSRGGINDVAASVQQGTLIEGLGDEVVVMVVVAVVSLCTLVFLSRQMQRETRLHPEQAQAVESTRRDMGIEQPAETTNESESCPVCLAPLRYPVQTNCGHMFCAHCVISYWRHDQWPQPARCPVCRRQVTLLLADESLQQAAGEGQQLWTEVTDYNQRMSGEWRPLMHYVYDVPTLLAHLWRDLFTVRGLVLMHKLHLLFILLLVVMYLLSPFDLLPEIMLGVLGLLDDLVIIVCALVYISLIYRAHVANGMP